MNEDEKRAEELGNSWAYPQPLDPDGLPSEAWVYANFEPGLTKRELFAAMAMQGMCASECTTYHSADVSSGDVEISRLAVAYADALIAELSKPQEGGAS